MQIKLLLWPYSELRTELKRHPDLWSQKVLNGPLELTWPSKRFQLLLEIWNQIPFASARTEFLFSSDHLATSELFEVWNQTTGYSLSAADRRYFYEQEDNSQVLISEAPVVRYFSQVRLSKPTCKSRHISALDAPVPVFLIDSNEAAIWTDKCFTGLDFGPAYGHRGKKADDKARLIVPRHIMPPMEKGSNIVINRLNQMEYFHLIGFSIYNRSAIQSAQDFNFSREPTCDYGFSRILISRRFRDFYEQRGLTGWVLRPVLETGSTHYQDFQKTLKAFLADWATGHPKNRLVGP